MNYGASFTCVSKIIKVSERNDPCLLLAISVPSAARKRDSIVLEVIVASRRHAVECNIQNGLEFGRRRWEA